MLKCRDMSQSEQIRQGESPAKRAFRLLPPLHRTSLLFFGAVTFFYWVALYMYTPILPVYAQSLGASLSVVGTVVAAYGLPQLLLRIPLGVWTDVVSRRKPLVAGGIVMTSVGALGLGLAPNPSILALARLVSGVGAATWLIFIVYFVSYYPREDMSRAVSVISFVNQIALVVASFSGGMVAELWGFRPTFMVAASVGVVAFIVLMATKEPIASRTESASWRGFTSVATRPLLLIVSGMGILLHFAQFSTIFGFIPVYGASIGASKADLGIIAMLAMASSAVGALAAASISERRGSTFAVVMGSVLMGVTLVATPFITSVGVLEAVQVVNGLGRGVLNTTLVTLSMGTVPPHQRATAMGVYQATYSVGMMIGPLISGFLADSLGLGSVFYLSAAICIAIAAIAVPITIIPRR